MIPAAGPHRQQIPLAVIAQKCKRNVITAEDIWFRFGRINWSAWRKILSAGSSQTLF